MRLKPAAGQKTVYGWTRTIRKIYLPAVLLFTLVPVFGQIYPLKNRDDDVLFHIARSRDADIVIYRLNRAPGGALDPSEPIRPVWLKLSQQGQRAPLTRIQQRFGYGLKIGAFDPALQRYPFQFVSIPNEWFYLKKSDRTGNYGVFFYRSGRALVLQRIFIQFDGGTFLKPRINQIQLFGKDSHSNQAFVEIVEP